LIGAVRVCGRWVSKCLLGRFSRRARSANPPSRRGFIEDFCRALHWRDGKGRLSISSAGVALRRLEKQGLVQLPPPLKRAQPSLQRRLLDDQEPLPKLPKLPRQAGQISGLRVRLIQDDRDPAHRLWNRIVSREHPLGRSPLVGPQLRYLIECEEGIIGAVAFSPAAYHLECRDQWIGWTSKARNHNRQQVIGLARFVIRPGLSCSCLASRCYGLVLKAVALDWFQRYGITPVLVETYVDRQNHQGKSLAAANWRRIGESKGRGRDDRERLKPKSLKDVWIYELDPKARLHLQTQPVELLAPRSVFAGLIHSDELAEEMAGVDLGDRRLNQRIKRMLQARWQHPTFSFCRSFGSLNETKAAYEMVESPRPEINLQSLLAPHRLQTARRMAAEKVVLLAQDTTALSYNGLHATKDLGPIGEDYTRGLLLHSGHAFRLNGLPLGVAYAEIWARAEAKKGVHRNDQSVDEKESGRWLRVLQEAGQLARQMPGTRLIVCGDRESDIYELYDQKQALPANVDLLVRAQHDRCLTDGTRLKASLEGLPAAGTMIVDVPRHKDQPRRKATLQLRWQQIEVCPPAVAMKKSWPSLKLYAVLAREVRAPVGVEPIQWLLLTTWPVESLRMARRIVQWYAIRWGIECWHRVLKSGCGVERRQMKTALALERALALDMIVASRVLLLNRLGKEHPDLPAELFYSPEELEILSLKKKHLRKSIRPTGNKLTVLQANILVAMFAGFLGRKCDGHPGAQTLAQGLQIVQALLWYKRQTESYSQRGPARSPT